MLLFSVRRGSALIGQPDSLMGLPIEEGDILMPPVEGGNGNPAIFIAAEALGLSTSRSGGNGDELNAADSGGINPFRDCNYNNVEDAVDIGNGTSADVNMNGIPDECEPPGTPFCFCGTGAPCGNTDANAGCANSLGTGALMTGTGSSSVGSDDLVLTTTGMPANMFGLTFMGGGSGAPIVMGDGLRCVVPGSSSLYRYPVQNAGASGSFALGPGIVSTSQGFQTPGQILVGASWHFQTWYRDPTGPCGSTSAVSSAWSVTFTQ